VTARFRRRGGALVARLTGPEVAVLRQLVGEVVGLLGPGAAAGDDPLATAPAGTTPLPDDPVLARLLPDGYRDDPDAAAELRRLTESSLRAEKVQAADVLLADLPPGGGMVRLDEEQAAAWLAALNDVRLALGTRLDVTEELDIDAEVGAAPDADRSYALAVYGWLTYLQDSLVEAVSPAG
jgi:hypothetical protein